MSENCVGEKSGYTMLQSKTFGTKPTMSPCSRIQKKVIIIKSNFNALVSILKSMIQKIFFLRVRMIINYTSLDSAVFGLSEYVVGFFSRSKKG